MELEIHRGIRALNKRSRGLRRVQRCAALRIRLWLCAALGTAPVRDSARCRLEWSRQMKCRHVRSKALPEDLPLSLAQVADMHRHVLLIVHALERLEALTAVGP